MSSRTRTRTADTATDTTEATGEATPTNTTTATEPTQEATKEASAMPGWNAPRPRLQDAPDDRATMGADVGDGPAPSSAEASSPASTEDVLATRNARVKLGAQVVGAVLAAAGGLLNVRARQAEDDDIWLMTRDEVDGIATPLGRVAARRGLVPGGSSDTGDITDLVSAGIGAVAYVIRNLQESATRRRAAAATPTYGDQGDTGDQGDQGDVGGATSPVVPPSPVSPVDSIAVNGNGAWGGSL